MNFSKIFVLMLVAIFAASFVSAQNLGIEYVKLNGEIFDNSSVGAHTNNLQLERGEDLNIRVRVKALADVNNVQVEADIYGYEYSDNEEYLVSDTSKVFDMGTGDVDNVDLELEIPIKMDKKYTLLRIRVGDEDGTSFEEVYQLRIVGISEEDAIIIKDYSFSPSTTIAAGRAFTSTVKIQNIGDKDLDDVKVVVSMPELNVRDSEYLDSLDADEKETLDNFLLRVPDCAEPGVYDVEINVEFDEYESTSESTQITVLPGDACTVQQSESRTVVSVPGEQEFAAGAEGAYPILITNQGTTQKTYTITVSGVESWGEYRLSSPVIVVPAGDTETVYLYVEADRDVSGEKVFLATVTSDNDSKEFALTADIDGREGGLKKGLEVALVVLVIILIIIGLIIGFNKLRGSEDDGAQTYY